MEKRDLSERDICTKLITPAILQAEWKQEQFREEVKLTPGRVIVRGKVAQRVKDPAAKGGPKRSDYVLYAKPNIALATLEAKRNGFPVGHGMQQALGYAEMLDAPFAISSNGDGFLFYDRTGISDLCASDASVTIKIVSFGPIGPELLKAYDNDQDTPTRPLNTLTTDREEKDKDGDRKTIKGLTEEKAKEVFKRVDIEVVDEDTLTQHVIEKLKATMTSGNPEVAFENLMWWLISSAEKQKRLRPNF